MSAVISMDHLRKRECVCVEAYHQRLRDIGLHIKNSPHGLQQLYNRAGLSCWTIDKSHPSYL